MKIAIIDDNAVFARELKERITQTCQKNNYTFSCTIIEQTEIILNSEMLCNYDVIFLDIEMPHISGFQLAEEINTLAAHNKAPYIVFISSHNHLVYEALKLFPYSFIRKCDLNAVDECLHKLSGILTTKPLYSVKAGRDTKMIEIEKILYIEKHRNYAAVFTTEGTFQERSSIDDKYRDLAPYSFLRPNIGTIVNAEHIKEYKNDCLKMSNGVLISISRTYKKSFKEELQKWMVKI